MYSTVGPTVNDVRPRHATRRSARKPKQLYRPAEPLDNHVTLT